MDAQHGIGSPSSIPKLHFYAKICA